MNLMPINFIFCLLLFFNYNFADDKNSLSERNITIEIKNIKNADGSLLVKLQDKEGNMIKGVKVKPQSPSVAYTFKNLKPGSYAVAIFHDENDNEKLDFNLIGLPLERYGFSNNVRGTFGPPEISKQLFEVQSDMKISITLQ